MSIADELRKLQELHAAGSLTEAEFARAKATLLAGASPVPGTAGPDGNQSSISPDVGLTSERLRVMQIIAGALIAGVVIFLGVVLFAVHGQNNGRGLTPPGGFPV